MSILLLKARLALELPPINAALDRAEATLPGSVRPVAHHIFSAGGKRLRPLLVVLTARLLGRSDTDVYDLAVTLEMLHAATLLHDDVLDGAATRRGRPAAHTVFGPTQAILAGDALLAQANAIVASFGEPALCTLFSRAIVETCSGEIREIEAQRRPQTAMAEYESIIRGKTAWLIRASCEMGALAAHATEAQREACAAYGEGVGMAFQLVDDALDFAPESVIGKPSGGDLREGKLTPPLRYYRDALNAEGRMIFDNAFANGSMPEEECRVICSRIRDAGYDRKTRDDADKWLAGALSALGTLPDATERELMRQMAEYVRERKK